MSFKRAPIQTRIIKRADDPSGIVRLNVGGDPETAGYYCVYRGTREQAIAALEHAAAGLRQRQREPEISPETRNAA